MGCSDWAGDNTSTETNYTLCLLPLHPGSQVRCPPEVEQEMIATRGITRGLIKTAMLGYSKWMEEVIAGTPLIQPCLSHIPLCAGVCGYVHIKVLHTYLANHS